MSSGLPILEARGRPESPLAVARHSLAAGIERCLPERVTRNAVQCEGSTLVVAGERYELSEYDSVVLLGAGKASGGMAAALEETLGDRLDAGAIVTTAPVPLDTVAVHEGTHPVPSDANVDGTERILELASEADDGTLVFVTISGGGSALLTAPASGVSLTALGEVTDQLLRSGRPIDDLNVVRKHLSRVKGGRLAATLAPATTVGLVISDVVGDDRSVIASGPLSPDDSTYDQAQEILDDCGRAVPAAVDRHLSAGARGELPETPTVGDSVFEDVSVEIIVNGGKALDEMADIAAENGYRPLVLSSQMRGEAVDVGRTVAAVAAEALETGRPAELPVALLTGGELTVAVTGDGVGGPNQEFVLSAWRELAGRDLVVGAVDSDGRDGGTDIAGALVDCRRAPPTAAEQALARNDAGTALDGADALVRTGRTGTNVNDLRIVLVGRPERFEGGTRGGTESHASPSR